MNTPFVRDFDQDADGWPLLYLTVKNVERLRGGVIDTNQALVGIPCKLLLRCLVDVRRSQEGIELAPLRQAHNVSCTHAQMPRKVLEITTRVLCHLQGPWKGSARCSQAKRLKPSKRLSQHVACNISGSVAQRRELSDLSVKSLDVQLSDPVLSPPRRRTRQPLQVICCRLHITPITHHAPHAVSICSI